MIYERLSSLTGSLASLAHHFLDVGSRKLQLGGPGYELVYGCTGIPPCLRSLTPSGSLEVAWAAIAAHEQTLLEPLLAYLRGKADRGVRIVGEEKAGLGRVPTVSFVVVGERAMRIRDVVSVFDRKGNVSRRFCALCCSLTRVQVGIRYGHFYAYTLVDRLEPKVDVGDGVVRISLVHYNTVEEVQKIIETLDEALA